MIIQGKNRMLYHFFDLWTPFLGNSSTALSVLRIFLGTLTAFILSLLFGRLFIGYFKKDFQAGVREYTPESHKMKGKTPTMGGLFVLLAVFVSVLLWSNFLHAEILIFFGIVFGYSAIGLWDDWYKIAYKKGISEKQKSCAQVIVASLGVSALVYIGALSTCIVVPFSSVVLASGWLFFPWAIFIIVGTSNAVNLTDGLDGLAISSLIPNFVVFGIFALTAAFIGISADFFFALALVIGLFVGASLGFAWYNLYPARVFMGDVGSLSLGAALATIALLTKQELLLPFTGIVFVVETLSVILQVFWFKRFGVRIFKMSPLHHHFELSGWKETTIVSYAARVTLLTCVLMLLMTLLYH